MRYATINLVPTVSYTCNHQTMSAQKLLFFLGLFNMCVRACVCVCVYAFHSQARLKSLDSQNMMLQFSYDDKIEAGQSNTWNSQIQMRVVQNDYRGCGYLLILLQI